MHTDKQADPDAVYLDCTISRSGNDSSFATDMPCSTSVKPTDSIFILRHGRCRSQSWKKNDTSVDAESIPPACTGSKRQKGPRPMANSIVDVKLVHLTVPQLFATRTGGVDTLEEDGALENLEQ